MTDDLSTLFPSVSDGAALPDYARADGEMGNEAITQNDMAVPRINLLQALSPPCQEGVPGARPGLLMNTVTDEIFEEICVVNLFFVKTWALFKKKKYGSGFHGNHPSLEAAESERDQLPGEDYEYEIFETGRHSVLLLDDNGEVTGPAEILMKSSNLNVSRQWNTQIKTKGKGAPRFALVWKIGGELKKGKEFTWHVYNVKLAGATPEHIYEEAKVMYQGLAAQADGVPF